MPLGGEGDSLLPSPARSSILRAYELSALKRELPRNELSDCTHSSWSLREKRGERSRLRDRIPDDAPSTGSRSASVEGRGKERNCYP
jgi:hypothetical protein